VVATPAIFFDGTSNRRHAVMLRFSDRLEIVDESGRLARWSYDGIRRVDGPPGVLRLWSGEAAALARLEVRDAAGREMILRACQALDGEGGVRPVAIWRVAAWSAAAAAAIIGMIWFGVPVLADQIAEAMPPRWERPLGDAVDKQVRAIFSGEPCTAPPGQRALGVLVDRLQSAAALPIPPDPVVLRSGMANAFALPGGRVYILSALLRRARSPDELAGVLAHEMGHVAHRDGLRRLIRDGGTGFLVGLLFGDVSGAGAALFAARSLLNAAYSREVEAGADGFAIAVMRRLGRPTAPLGALLERITGDDDGAMPSLLRDHPLTPERVARLNEAGVAPSGPELLTAAEWRALRAICRQGG
jgi:Zn-dependent protease with chaperone function